MRLINDVFDDFNKLHIRLLCLKGGVKLLMLIQ